MRFFSSRRKLQLLLGAACSALVLLVVFAIVGYVYFIPHPIPPLPFVTPSDKAGWKEDLNYLASEIPRKHENAFHSISRPQFEHAMADFNAEIPELDTDEILVGFMRITSMIGDGHTRIALPPNFHAYPLQFYWFGDTLRVVKAAPEYQRALGAKVIGVGNSKIADVFEAVTSLIPAGENEMWLRRVSPSLLVSAEILHGLHVTPTAKEARYTFEDANGNRFALDLQARMLSETQSENNWVTAAKAEPLYLQHPAENVWFSYLESQQTLYLQYNLAPSYWTFYRFSKNFLDFLDHHPVKILVVDLRLNRGGDLTKFKWLLLPELVKRRFRQQCFACPREINKPPRLYVIIGRDTYSAGLVNAVELKDQAAAFLVGEPTGARPNAYGEDRSFMLPNSHLVVSVSTRYYRLVQEDMPALMPDQRINPSWSDFVTGHDPVLDWILNQRGNP